jgi:hypothetical protein
MKNWLYVPFLVLMAITYTRLTENLNSEDGINAGARAPASVEVDIYYECSNVAGKFNQHYVSENCL